MFIVNELIVLSNLDTLKLVRQEVGQGNIGLGSLNLTNKTVG